MRLIRVILLVNLVKYDKVSRFGPYVMYWHNEYLIGLLSYKMRRY